MIRKRFHQYWVFECPEVVLTCSILKCGKYSFLVFGGHDKTLYFMDDELMILDDINFDGWCRCSYPIDLDGDKCEELLVGAGDGRFLVLKLDKEKNKLIGIMNHKSTGIITTCAAGDLYRDGNIELIIGGEDKKLQIFKDINSKESIVTFYYDSWVTSCALGYLKLPQFRNPIYGLLIGTKNGLLQLVHVKDGKPEILWQQNIYSQINDVKIGDITNNGYNEIIVASDDSYVKIYDSEGKRLRFIKIEKIKPRSKKEKKPSLNRPVSLLIEDIDGDKANEIIVGCADGSLRAFHNTKLDSKNFELKWIAKYKSSIKDICSWRNGKNNITHIIFGGYERTIRNLSDFEINAKPILKIPTRFRIKEIPIKKSIEEKPIIEPVPTNLREFIVKLLEERGFFLTLDLLVSELLKEGYTKYEIEEELESMKAEKTMRYGKIDLQAWSLASEEVEDLIEHEITDSEQKNIEKSKSKKEPKTNKNSQ